jgi:predicted PurR-regulated permease PerM
MIDTASIRSVDRSRVGWWAYVVALALVAAFVVYSFVGTFVLGIFAYYAARPLYDRISRLIDSDGVAAAATVLGFVLPIVLLLTYAGVHVVTSLQSAFGGAPGPIGGLLSQYVGVKSLPQEQWAALSQVVNSPLQALRQHQQALGTIATQGANVLGTVANGLLHLTLALAMAFYLLRDDDSISSWFHSNVASEGSATAGYLTAVDSDLESLYFGNLLFVAVMSVIAAVVYFGTNMLAPQGLSIPIPLVLAVLTGVSSLIPLVVGKVVYVPLTVYLAASAMGSSGNHLFFVGAFLVVCVFVLDLLPQGFVQPYVTGRKLHPGLLLFAYILGPVVWGWYGFFLLPLVVVLVVEVVRLTFTDLVHGDTLTPDVEAAESLGTTDPGASGDGSSSGASTDGGHDGPTGDGADADSVPDIGGDGGDDAESAPDVGGRTSSEPDVGEAGHEDDDRT